uniref:Down Syndrome Cell Adhesion Molecules n=1 Tax=Chelicerata TaxID=6843 RepID=UPI0024B877E9|nr:Chain A, Down Syndrome Cell Adhesion Molecules [Chelicerata]7Y8H_B Chain B, Down Syndrome Cell Adhesion Molecules [Chelicerata]
GASPPSPPRGIKVSEVTTRTARLSWQSPYGNGDNTVVTYIVRYWRDEESRSQLHQLTFQVTSANLKDLHPGTSYAVQILAENDVGASIPSRLVQFRTIEE